MSAAKLASLGGLAGTLLLVALWWQRHDPVEKAAEPGPPAITTPESQQRTVPASPAAAAASQARPLALRPGEAELRTRAGEEAYARIGGALVDYLVERGLARGDGEPVVRRLLADTTNCLFDALRIEADAQSASFDSVLDALEAELYDTDGPLLAAVIDMRAVVNRVAPCAQTEAQQAGIEPAALPEATRAALIRALR